MDPEPTFALCLSPSPGAPCVECDTPTGQGVVAIRNGRPLCDRCLLDEHPALAAPLVAMHVFRLFGQAFAPFRPEAPTGLLAELLDAAPGKDAAALAVLLTTPWSKRWGRDRETVRYHSYDLEALERTLRAEGVPEDVASRAWDLDFVDQVAGEARTAGEGVHEHLLARLRAEASACLP